MIKVTRVFRPYTPGLMKDQHIKMSKDFGALGKNWGLTVSEYNVLANTLTIDYWFENDADSTVFVLKYTKNAV